MKQHKNKKGTNQNKIGAKTEVLKVQAMQH